MCCLYNISGVHRYYTAYDISLKIILVKKNRLAAVWWVMRGSNPRPRSRQERALAN